MNIVADDREQAPGILELLSTSQSINLIRQRLTVGDYLIDDWLIIERKQLRDLLISIIDGRLFSQAQRLSDSGFQPLLIIEATPLISGTALWIGEQARRAGQHRTDLCHNNTQNAQSTRNGKAYAICCAAAAPFKL